MTAPEPVYDAVAAADIQGNIIPGFTKDHQYFLFLRFGDRAGARRFTTWLAPRVTSMAAALDFRARRRTEHVAGQSAVWTAVAFSYNGIVTLAGSESADAFGEHSFRQGLSARSAYLGDPTASDHRGSRVNWSVGGPGNEADALIVVAADVAAQLRSAVRTVRRAADRHGVVELFGQRCAMLPGALRGHEHFGFRDGISHPGVRGVRSTGVPVTPRYLASDDPLAALFAKPGQPLVWPGQFLLGEPRQDPQQPLTPAAAATNFPDWARLGSFLVCRRLNQDVPAFWGFATTLAERLGIAQVHAAALLVGRWPSGAPVSRSPEADDAVLAGDEFANNHFLFDDPTRPARLTPIPGYAPDSYPSAAGDVFGVICPHAAHIRKVNPRDSGTDFGAPADTLLRLMLRRGIPFGRPVAGVLRPSPARLREERGLMFVAYMASIEEQFEFVTRRWVNSAVQPNLGGHDPLIGQRNVHGDRTRTLTLPRADGSVVEVPVPGEWVTPTGGGYFFAPPISALTGALAVQPARAVPDMP